jgi:hypothetical protein
MSTITIPQELKNEKKLVAVPHKAYEEFLDWQRRLKSKREFIPTENEKKTLRRARKNAARGVYMTLTELGDALGIEG